MDLDVGIEYPPFVFREKYPLLSGAEVMKSSLIWVYTDYSSMSVRKFSVAMVYVASYQKNYLSHFSAMMAVCFFMFSVNIGQQLLMALLDNWPKTHIYEQQGK